MDRPAQEIRHLSKTDPVMKRLIRDIGPCRWRPRVRRSPFESLSRGAGFSQAKVAALRDLAAKTLDGTVPTGAIIRKLDDEAIIERLIAVCGKTVLM